MPFRLFRNRSLSVGMTVTFIYMATFGTLPYFLTVLMQNVHGYSALQTGLAFLVPSVAIANGMASTTLNIGNAIGLAVLTAIADVGTDGKAGDALRHATADGEFLVVLLTAAGMLIGLLITTGLPRETTAPTQTAAEDSVLTAR